MIKKIKETLLLKLFLFTAVLAVLCCLITYRLLSCYVPNFYQYDLAEAERGLSVYSRQLSGKPVEDAPSIFQKMEKSMEIGYGNEFEYHFFRSDGQEVSLKDIHKLTGKKNTDFDSIEKSDPYPVTFSNDKSAYTLLLTRNAAEYAKMKTAMRRSFPFLCIVISGVSFLHAFFYYWYIAAPIKKISKTAKQMAEMDFSGSCPAGRRDEIGILSDSLNTMSHNLKEALLKLQADITLKKKLEEQRMAFFTAASHELKTPVTIIKGQLQGMLYQVGRYKNRDIYLAQSLKVTDTLEKMIQDLLTISRLNTMDTCQKSRIDLGSLIKERISACEDLFLQKDLTVEASILPETFVFGNQNQLQKVLDNLLGNAAAYSGAGNAILVTLWKTEETINLSIENTGASIPDKDIPRLFEAFYRADPSRNRQTGGTGLGLHIVKTILDLHGAEIEISNTARGVLVLIRFRNQIIQEETDEKKN